MAAKKPAKKSTKKDDAPETKVETKAVPKSRVYRKKNWCAFGQSEEKILVPGEADEADSYTDPTFMTTGFTLLKSGFENENEAKVWARDHGPVDTLYQFSAIVESKDPLRKAEVKQVTLSGFK